MTFLRKLLSLLANLVGTWSILLAVIGFFLRPQMIATVLPGTLGVTLLVLANFRALGAFFSWVSNGVHRFVNVHWNGISEPPKVPPQFRREEVGDLKPPHSPSQNTVRRDPQPAPKPQPQSSYQSHPTGPGDPLAELMGMRGMKTVKADLTKMLDSLRVQKKKSERGLPVSPGSLHMVFVGPPGTGKTTVARLVGPLLRQLGYLSKGHFVETDRSKLVDNILGGTEARTSQIIAESLGGVLFIDEAYSLTPKEGGRDFGKIVVDLLIKAMEDHRDDWVVIVAGYAAPMETFISSNSGLQSRMPRRLVFDNYHLDDLMEIFKDLMKKEHLKIASDGLAKVSEYLSWKLKTQTVDFGNAREVRNLFEKVRENQEARIAATKSSNLERVNVEDVPTSGDYKEAPRSTEQVRAGIAEALKELESIVGLETVKAEVKTLVNLIETNLERQKRGLSTEALSLNFIFSGPPGTGKTTVARVLGKILYSLGLISTNTLLEVDRQDLVAGYVGQTAIKTKEVLERAKNGVLFIDEAYTLAQGRESQYDFGAEAVATILKFVEDNRGQIAIILAGYGLQLDSLLSTNPGLSSRFQNRIEFTSYTSEELWSIFQSMARGKSYILGEGMEQRAKQALEAQRREKGGDFGNGRAVRNLFENALKNQANRLGSSGHRSSDMPDHILLHLTPEDISPSARASEPPASLSATMKKALKDSLATAFWFKNDLKAFLKQNLTDHKSIDDRDWGSKEKKKRDILDDFLEAFLASPTPAIDELLRLGEKLSQLTEYPSLAELPDAEYRLGEAARARESLKRALSDPSRTGGL